MCAILKVIIWVLYLGKGDSLPTSPLKEQIKVKPYFHSPPPTTPPPPLLPGPLRSSVPSSFWVPDISFTVWLALLFIETYTCYILPSISRYFIARFFFNFSSLSYSSEKILCTGFRVETVFIQTPEGVLLAGLVTPFSLPLALLPCAPFKVRGYGMMEGYTSFYPQGKKVQSEMTCPRASTLHISLMRHSQKLHPPL